MRKILVLFIGLMSVYSLSAQEKRKSPKVEVSETIGETKVAINYGQPSMREREIFGALVPYGKVWRTGANEATTIEFSNAVSISGKEVPAGKYALFTIPNESSWTIILNSVSDQWGAYNYNASKDVLRFDVKPTPTKATEAFTITVSSGGSVEMKWENTAVHFKIEEA